METEELVNVTVQPMDGNEFQVEVTEVGPVSLLKGRIAEMKGFPE